MLPTRLTSRGLPARRPSSRQTRIHAGRGPRPEPLDFAAHAPRPLVQRAAGGQTNMRQGDEGDRKASGPRRRGAGPTERGPRRRAKRSRSPVSPSGCARRRRCAGRSRPYAGRAPVALRREAAPGWPPRTERLAAARALEAPDARAVRSTNVFVVGELLMFVVRCCGPAT